MLIKKMTAILKDNQLGGRYLLNQFPDVPDGAKLVSITMNKQDRFSNLRQKLVVSVLIHRRPDAYQTNDTVVRHPDFHSGTRSERETRKRDLLIGILGREIIEHITDIIQSAGDFIMLAGGRSDTAEIESQGGKSGVNQSGGCTEHDLVVHCPATKRMRMTDQPDALRFAGRLLQDRLQPSVRSGNKQIAFGIHV